jgi:2,5-dihydroxypyridine 5,6-dioxygenase
MSRLQLAGSRGADVLVRDHFCIQPGETVVVTADTATDSSAIDAIMRAAHAAGARPMLLMVPQLPYQGKLADPYVPDALGKSVESCDVWFDMTFPYLAGSAAYDQAIKSNRARYLLLGDLDGAGLDRLYGNCDLDRLFEVQTALDELLASNEGAECRVTNPAGSDVTFRLGRTTTKKSRYTRNPGSSTIMGSAIFYPEPDSVRGDLFVDAMFHEFYTLLPKPLHLVIDGHIRELRDGGTQAILAERALRRANGGDFGRVIHFTIGFHPAAHFSGNGFIEDIRSPGANAIGLGIPWWEPGGGENHPDVVLTTQSVWLAGRQVVKDGTLIYPADLADKARQLGTVA